MTDEVKPPTVLGFTLRERLAARSGRETFLALDRLGAEFVLKLHDLGEAEAEGLAEASLEGLEHPGLAVCRAAHRLPGEGRLAIVFDRVRGTPAAPGAWDRVEPASAIAGRLLSALGALHRAGRLHRDLKDENVLLEDGRRPVLIDFGLSAPVDAPGPAAGTPRAMAPELFAGAAPSVASDLWSAGLLLTELFLGRRLFHGEDTEALLTERRTFAGLSPADRAALGDASLAVVLERLLDPVPDRRHADAATALAALSLPDDPDLAREDLAGALSAAFVRADPRRAARRAALGEGRVWIELGDRDDLSPGPCYRHLAALAASLPRPGPEVEAALRAAGSDEVLPTAGMVASLGRALAAHRPLTAAVPDQAPGWVDEVASALDGTAGLTVWRPTPPSGSTASAVLEDGVGPFGVLAERLTATAPGSWRELSEALTELVTSGALTQGARGVVLDEERLPPAWPLADEGSRPLAALGDEERATLAVLALSPRPLRGRVLAEVLDRDPAPDLAALGARGWLTARRVDGVACPVPADARLVRAARGEVTLDEDVRRRLALALAPAEGDEPDEATADAVALVLGHEGVGSRDDQAVSRCVQRGAEVLRRVARLDRAVVLLRRGVEGAAPASPERRGLQRDLIDVLVRAGRRDEAWEVVSRAREDGPDDGWLAVREARLLQLAGRLEEAEALLAPLPLADMERDDAVLGLQIRALVRSRTGHLPEAHVDLREALRRQGAEASRRSVALLDHLGILSRRLGQHDEAVRAYERAIALARSLGHETLVWNSQYNLGRAIRDRGETRRGLAIQEEATRQCERHGDPASLANLLNGLGAGWLQLGQVDVARRHLGRAASLAEQGDLDELLARVLNNEGEALSLEGRRDEASRCFERSLSLRRAAGDTAGIAAVCLNRAPWSLAEGRVEEAAADLDLAREALARRPSDEGQVQADLLAAELALERGDGEAGRSAANAALERAREAGLEGLALGARELLARGGQDDLEDLDPAGEERGSRLAGALIARATLRAAAGRPEAAGDDLEAALAVLGETPHGPLEARALVARLGLDVPALERELSSDDPDFVDLGGVLSRVSQDLDRAAELVERHGLAHGAADLADLKERFDRMQDHDDTMALTALSGRLRDLERLVEINKLLNTERDTQKLLDLIIDSAVEITGAARGFLILFDGRAEEFRAARNIDESTIHDPQFQVSHSVARRVVREGRALLTANALDDPQLASSSVSELKLLSILCVPLLSRQRTLGAVYLDHPQVVGRFKDSHLATVTSLAEQAAIALENARLSKGLEETNVVLQESQVEIARLNEALQQRLQRREAELEEARESLDASRRALALRYDYSNIVTRSPRMHEVLDLMDRVTDTHFPVVIYGESGTGKELIARALHFNGPRQEKNFLSINCAAIAEPLIESELFGSKRGAFTGADRDRKGLFEQAHGGTLFMDEIGDMSPDVQKRLLRVLQEGEFIPVGGTEVKQVDVRILCATHRDLSQLVQEGTFREDLYYRLAVARIDVPPLRERREDVAVLLAHFLERHGTGPREFEPEALTVLEAQAWPGNVRQLENLAMNLILFDRDGQRVGLDLVERVLGEGAVAPGEGPGEVSGLGEDQADLPLKARMEAFERAQVRSALEASGGNKAQAARALGVGVRSFYKMLDRLGLS